VSTRAALRALIILYAFARVLPIFSGNPPPLGVVALHVLPPLAFALLHGADAYGWRGTLIFTGICLAIGNIAENIGVATGFPFGRYYFTDFMGPKIFHVPVFLGLAYIGMGYVSWVLGCVVLGSKRRRALPLLAAVIMTTWDLSLDPTWSTVLHTWIWVDGGAFFGVPLTNFLGWLLTTYLIYQSFVWLLRGAKPVPADWQSPIVFYGVSALGNFLQLIPLHKLAVVTDPAGRVWKISGIATACAGVSVMMLVICVAAWRRQVR
jgi:putative membrane protein